MKTLYDWYPGRHGELLVAKGSKSIQQSVVVGIVRDHDVLRELYDDGRLTGRALADARFKYEGKVETPAGSMTTP